MTLTRCEGLSMEMSCSLSGRRGSTQRPLVSIQALARWIDGSGYQSVGYARELMLKLSDVRDDWVTELHEPIAETSG